MTNILLVDDDQAVRDTLSDILLSAGYAVEQAEDGARALSLIEQSEYDLIVLDVFMPEIDGIELIRTLDKRDTHPPLITISGGGGVLPPSWSSKITEVFGIASALTKPIDMNDFLAAVEDALKSD